MSSQCQKHQKGTSPLGVKMHVTESPHCGNPLDGVVMLLAAAKLAKLLPSPSLARPWKNSIELS